MGEAVPDTVTVCGELTRLFLCLDGTWNTADADEITNIVRIRDLIDPKYTDSNGLVVKQRVYYEPGVGTWGTRLTRLLDGATSGGLEDNVRGAYRFLFDIHKPGQDVHEEAKQQAAKET